ncbi:MAG: hypothetical protein Q8M67_00790, partial [Bacteroidota bacterium]|nr:hypothetical protein [Bacteroidota bacterium]
MTLEIENHNNNLIKSFRAKDIDGICNRIVKITNARRTLISSVSLSENYLQDLAQIIYKTYPERINSKDTVEAIGQQIKLMQVIFDSQDKSEMFDKIIEEKLRGIFYGNPIDFFEKDKAKLGFENLFKDKYPNALKQYAEITNRRNINIHNEGRVDRKYIRETGSSLKLDSKPEIDKAYLKSSIMLLLGLSSTATKIVLEKTLTATKYHKFITSSYKRFDNDYK